jgi:riboflavin transporter FmnP
MYWVAITDGWIFFFLATKPLWDLTWRWRFFQILDQGVNVQTFVGLIVLALNAIAILRRASWRHFPKRVLILIAFATLSVLLTPSTMGINELLRLLAGVSFFYTAGPLLSRQRTFDRFAKLFLAATVVPIVLSFFQVVGMLPYDYWDYTEAGQIGRASGTYQTPLSLNYFLIIAIPLALSIASGKQQQCTAKRCAWTYLTLACVAVAFTNHRTTYLIVALQFILWFSMGRRWKAVFGFCSILALVVLLSFGWLKMLYAPLMESLSGGTDVQSGQFLRGRGFQWFLFLDSYASGDPIHWILGQGGSVIKGYDPMDSTEIDSTEPHNDFIRVLHAYGAVGLLLYVSILALLLRKTVSLLHSRDEFPRLLARIILLVLVAILTLSMMIEPLRYPAGAWYLFALGSTLFCLKGYRSQLGTE